MTQFEQGTEGPKHILWLALSDQNRIQALSEAFEDDEDIGIVASMSPPQEAKPGIAVFQDDTIELLQNYRSSMADAFQAVLLTENTAKRRGEDFLLTLNSDTGSILSVIKAASEFRDQVLTLKNDVQRRK